MNKGTAINRYPSMVIALNDLQKRGYDCDFQMSGNSIKCLNSNKLYQAQDMTIVEYHRFEGISNPDDMSIVFVVECNDGAKGTVVSAYGTYADIKLLDFMDKVKIKENGQVAQDEQGQHHMP
ncbi:MAG: phosphoribosylpyrophosphate synthetase [Saprospiraceae bacterium]